MTVSVKVTERLSIGVSYVGIFENALVEPTQLSFAETFSRRFAHKCATNQVVAGSRTNTCGTKHPERTVAAEWTRPAGKVCAILR